MPNDTKYGSEQQLDRISLIKEHSRNRKVYLPSNVQEKPTAKISGFLEKNSEKLFTPHISALSTENYIFHKENLFEEKNTNNNQIFRENTINPNKSCVFISKHNIHSVLKLLFTILLIPKTFCINQSGILELMNLRPTQLVAVFDCGSTGTRLNTFGFKNHTLAFFNTINKEPGLQHLSKKNIKSNIQILIDKTNDLLKKKFQTELKHLEVVFLATAGLRMEGKRSLDILKTVEDVLKRNSLKIRECKTLQGVYEGLFALQSVRYLIKFNEIAKNFGCRKLALRKIFNAKIPGFCHDIPLSPYNIDFINNSKANEDTNAEYALIKDENHFLDSLQNKQSLSNDDQDEAEGHDDICSDQDSLPNVQPKLERGIVKNGQDKIRSNYLSDFRPKLKRGISKDDQNETGEHHDVSSDRDYLPNSQSELESGLFKNDQDKILGNSLSNSESELESGLFKNDQDKILGNSLSNSQSELKGGLFKNDQDKILGNSLSNSQSELKNGLSKNDANDPRKNLNKKIQKTLSTTKNPFTPSNNKKEDKFIGIIEMGGGSLQLAFEFPKSKKYNHSPHVIKTKKKNIYVTAFDGYGLNEAMKVLRATRNYKDGNKTFLNLLMKDFGNIDMPNINETTDLFLLSYFYFKLKDLGCGDLTSLREIERLFLEKCGGEKLHIADGQTKDSHSSKNCAFFEFFENKKDESQYKTSESRNDAEKHKFKGCATNKQKNSGTSFCDEIFYMKEFLKAIGIDKQKRLYIVHDIAGINLNWSLAKAVMLLD